MDSSAGQNTKRKNVALSILQGFVLAVVGFVIGTVLTLGVGLGLVSLLNLIFHAFYEVVPSLVIVLSPVVGVLTAVVMGIRSGRQTYKRLSEKE